ncbi:hypothetical protein HYX58_03035 [Candidatus Dependentiae bacterium]|nr:hypothetical protein [Candidatus Dependentiae bacterium]
MKLFNKKTTLLAISILTVATYIFYKKIYKPSKTGTQKHYEQLITDRQHQVWDSLESAGIKQNEFESFYEEYLPRYLKEDAETQQADISPEVLSVIHEVMHDLNIDPETVTITTFDDGSPAAATDGLLLINENKFKALSRESQLFALAHEFQHMRFKDGSTICALRETVKLHSTEQDDSSMDNPFNQYSRFIETRADINAAMIGPKYAQAYVTYMDESIKRSGENAGISHPKNSERLALAKEIYSEVAQA